METDFFKNETIIRLSIFMVGLMLFATLERLWPRRARTAYWPRWANNLGLNAISSVFVRFAIPLALSTVALLCWQHGIGILNHIALPAWIEMLAAIIVLDAAIYLQHRLMHRFHCLWRLHRVHHTDTAFDVSLALRFHPIEITLSLLYKFAVIAVIGAAPVAAMIYESLLLGFALWTHANLALPLRIDSLLRWVIVTPEMHRIHHSVLRYETDSNYGNILSIWDRCFGSYTQHSKQPQEVMPIGLDYFRNENEQNLVSLLAQPFQNPETH